MTNILVINGHSVKDSFCEALANEYIKGAKKAGAKAKVINLYDLKFDPVLKSGYRSKKQQKLEKDLIKVQNEIKKANHIVFTYPIWWGDMPALMKGFLDRAFTPGFAFDPKHKVRGLPKGLLTNKSARSIITMGAPTIFYKLFGKHSTKLMKFNLKYCGIKNIKASHFGRIDSSTEAQRKVMLEKTYNLGLKLQ